MSKVLWRSALKTRNIKINQERYSQSFGILRDILGHLGKSSVRAIHGGPAA